MGSQQTARKRWSKSHDLRQTIRELGWLNTCCYALDRLLAACSGGRGRIHKYYFVAQPVAHRPWLPPKRGADIEVRQIDESDPVIKEFPRPDRAMPYRFKQGAVCLSGSKAGQWIGFLWLTLGPYREDEVRCLYVPLPAGRSAWDFDVYLRPEQRNGIAFLKLWDEANRLLAARGYGCSLSRISAFNPGSMFSHARMGARRIGAATFLCIGRWQITLATLAPHFHFSPGPDSFPTIALHPADIRTDEPVR